MIVMQLNNIYKSFAGIPVFGHVQIEIKKNDRIAIVGRNGSGKSTLLKIMTQEISYDSGEIFQIKNLQIGYLAQHNDLNSKLTIQDEMLTLFKELINEENELLAISRQIEKNAHDGKTDYDLIHTYSERQEAFAEQGGYRYKSDISGVLIGLGFNEDEFDFKVNDLSGGQKTRLALGKLLLQSPDILILDEPTNHLDIPTLTWLENYLANYKGAIVIVSHDRYFLDKIVSTVYDVAYQRVNKYTGTYTQFLEKKAANYEQHQKMYEQQQDEIKTMEEFINRNIARASTTRRARSRRKQLEKLERIERPLGEEAKAKFSFDIKKSSGNDVLHIDDFSFQYNENEPPLFKDVTFHINKGERVALIGDNGVGKTTLLQSIMQKHPHITLGTNVEIGYYDQEQTNINDANTVLNEVWDHFPHIDEQTIRTVLGNFLFTGEDVLKTIHTLSGGEKARLALAKLMLQKANFLILDEPTNHLDVISKEVLENALQDYPGTILFVSHDRYFINKIADKVIELKSNGATIYLGDYNYYIDKKTEEAELKKLENENQTKSTEKKPTSYEQQREKQRQRRRQERQIKKIEEEIEILENKMSTLEEKLMLPDIQDNYKEMYDITSQIEKYEQEIETLIEAWENLHQ